MLYLTIHNRNVYLNKFAFMNYYSVVSASWVQSENALHQKLVLQLLAKKQKRAFLRVLASSGEFLFSRKSWKPLFNPDQKEGATTGRIVHQLSAGTTSHSINICHFFSSDLLDDEFGGWYAVLTFVFAWAMIRKCWPNKNGSFWSWSKNLITCWHLKIVTF